MFRGVSQYEVTHMENLMVRDSYWDDDYVSLCDVNDCEDCPRYGDDCDGKGEDEMDDKIAYYEKEGDEYVYYDENGCELYREDA